MSLDEVGIFFGQSLNESFAYLLKFLKNESESPTLKLRLSKNFSPKGKGRFINNETFGEEEIFPLLVENNNNSYSDISINPEVIKIINQYKN